MWFLNYISARSMFNQFIRSDRLTLLSCWVSEALAWTISKQLSQTELRSHMLIKLQIGAPGDHLRAEPPPPPPRRVKPAETGKHKREMEHNAPSESCSQSSHCSRLYKHLCHRDLLKLWPCHATRLRGRCVRFALSRLLCDFSISAFISFDSISGPWRRQLVFCAHLSHAFPSTLGKKSMFSLLWNCL